MSDPVITYYFWTISDWAYFGHERLVAMAAKHGVAIDYSRSTCRPSTRATGGILLGQRSTQRQAYRMAELALEGPAERSRRSRAEIFSGLPPSSSRLLVAAKLAGLPLGDLLCDDARDVGRRDRHFGRGTLRKIAARSYRTPRGCWRRQTRRRCRPNTSATRTRRRRRRVRLAVLPLRRRHPVGTGPPGLPRGGAGAQNGRGGLMDGSPQRNDGRTR